MILDLLFPKKCLGCGKTGLYMCNLCLDKVRPAGFTKTNISLYKYEGVIRKAIISLKYKYATNIAQELAIVCAKKLKKEKYFKRRTILIPIPLHRKKQNQRGFNQVEEIGLILAQKMGWKIAPKLLIRHVQTQPQVNLKKCQRTKNVSGVFSVNTIYKKTNSRLVIFDDVYTTGSTINEAIKTLKKEGYKNISSLTIAR